MPELRPASFAQGPKGPVVAEGHAIFAAPGARGFGISHLSRVASAQIKVRLQPRSSRSEIAGERAGAVLVRVTAPPVDGKANAALCRLIAERVGVPRRAVEVVRGRSARDKVVRVDGVEPAALREALGLGTDA